MPFCAMPFDRTAGFVLSLLALGVCGTAAADDELERLRLENQQLKAQLRTLQQNSPAQAAQPPATNPASTPAPAAATPSAANGVSVPVPAAPPPSPATVPAAAPAAPPAGAPPVQQVVVPPTQPATVVPPGYKLVPLNTPEYVDPLAPPYTRTGCSRGMMKGPPPAKWNDLSNWGGMQRGLSNPEVEDMLGKEHFDVSGHGRVEWQYGKCGDSIAGRVQFLDGKVVFWQVPDL